MGNAEGRRSGAPGWRTHDFRSDVLGFFYKVWSQQVLPDVDGAIQDCVFGVVALVMLTLPNIDAKDGLLKAQ